MSRTQLDKASAQLIPTDSATRLFAATEGREVWVLERNGSVDRTIDPADIEATETLATGYTTEAGGVEVTYPLLSDADGRFPDAWFAQGSYDIYIPTDTLHPITRWEAIIGQELTAGDCTTSADEVITGAWTFNGITSFGDVGDPGAYPEARARFYSVETQIDGRYVGTEHQHNYTPSGAPNTWTDYHGLDLHMAGSANSNSYVGIYAGEFDATYSGTGQIARIIGVYGYSQNLASGGFVTSDASSFQARVNNASGGTISWANGLFARNPINTGATIGTYAALRTDDLDDIDGTVTVGAYGLYVPGATGLNYLGGKLGIGIDDPVSPLHLGSDAGDNTSGIIFGSGIDTQLYRSGEGALTLNGTGAGGNLYAAGGIIQTGGYFAANGNTGANRAIFGYANGGNAAGFTCGSSLDVWLMRGSGTTLKSNAAYSTVKTSAPADSDLAAGEMAIWFDPTNGAAKLMVKAKETGGTVRTGSVSLT